MIEVTPIFVYAFALFSIFGIASISGIFSERVGIVNIGIDGMMIVGATFYGLFLVVFTRGSSAQLSSYMQIPLFILAGIFAMFFSWIHGFITINLKGNHVISGVAINLLGAGFAWLILLVAVPSLRNGDQRFTVFFNELAQAANPLGNDFGNVLSLKFLLFLLVAIVSYILLKHTKWGIRFKSIGENPQAADVAGINVNFYKWQGVSISGLLAGFAGAIAIQLIGASSFTGQVRGFGFIALSIMIMARWRVELAFFISFAFSVLYSLGTQIGTNNDYRRWESVLLIIPYLSAIVLLLMTSKTVTGPKAAGIPYDKANAR
ncbi:ABC transporter permease [Mycoplasmopsis agassizii]|uniref:ABC transporter permease n=1 Tax=Mycoplasmopsis agassizii TaxID=33922 RepID=UPI003527ADFF